MLTTTAAATLSVCIVSISRLDCRYDTEIQIINHIPFADHHVLHRGLTTYHFPNCLL